PGVSWAAHLGGAIAGLAIALWLNYFRWQTRWLRWLQWVGVIVVPAISVGLLIRTMKSGSEWQEIREDMEREEMNGFLGGMSSIDRQAQQTYSKEVEPRLEQQATRRNSHEVSKT